ncbi:hypothetical protein [Mucilaginibacter antarcticus]|uniref:hypothetical protein n=1 Tax=Mucilaginibacter antarcticus TaxID=1855725 RepID=UPI003626F22B
MEKAPIKRSTYVVTLSRDHHSGLLFCWKIKEGIKRDISFERLNNYIRYFWEGHLNKHFQEEEILLFNQIRHELTEQALMEHVQLKDLFLRISSSGLDHKEDYLFH